ncbi:MAG: calcium-binding protein [Candidatus Korobacteraceae bacterium]|jgi:hypothetical protein
MAKPKRDPIREDRIHEEVIVDANGPEEQAMGWYYYLEDKLRFPFQAKCIVSKVVSPLRKGETVEVRRMAPEEACSSDMFVLIRWQGRNMAVPLSQLVAIDAGESTTEAVGDWHYWVAQGYCF